MAGFVSQPNARRLGALGHRDPGLRSHFLLHLGKMALNVDDDEAKDRLLDGISQSVKEVRRGS